MFNIKCQFYLYLYSSVEIGRPHSITHASNIFPQLISAETDDLILIILLLVGACCAQIGNCVFRTLKTSLPVKFFLINTVEIQGFLLWHSVHNVFTFCFTITPVLFYHGMPTDIMGKACIYCQSPFASKLSGKLRGN